MLQVFINKEEVALSMEGTGSTITAEVGLLIGCIYRKLKEDNVAVSEAYKNALKKCIEKNIPFKTDDEVKEEIINALRKALREADN